MSKYTKGFLGSQVSCALSLFFSYIFIIKLSMLYNADELNYSGSLNKYQFIAGTDYKFILHRVPNESYPTGSLTGSGYFTFETKRNNDGFYSGSTPFVDSFSLTPGLQSSTTASGVKSLVSSSYKFAYNLFSTTESGASATSSFDLTNLTVDIPVDSVYLRCTGHYEMETVPVTEGCDTTSSFTGGQDYPTEVQSVFGTSTGTVTFQINTFRIPDRSIVDFNGSTVIDTGYLSNQPELYVFNDGTGNPGALRNSFINALDGREAPEGGTYPLTPGSGTGVNLIQADGYPDVSGFTGSAANYSTYTFNKNNATLFATTKVYGPMLFTGWNFIMSCPGSKSP